MMQPQDSSHVWDDDFDVDEGNEIVAPLVVAEEGTNGAVAANSADNESAASSSSALWLRQRKQQQRKRQKRLRSLELAMLRQEENDGYYYSSSSSSSSTTWLGDSWRFVASVLLACIVLAPLLLFYYRGNDSNGDDSSSVMIPWPSDELDCESTAQATYSQIYRNVSNAKSFCKSQQQATTTTSACDCTSPLVPKAAVDESQKEQWLQAMDRNVLLAANDENANSKNNDLDVVLLGDSITEHWQGTSMGRLKYPKVKRVYEQVFRNKAQTGVKGLALGISGDRCPQLLYRLKHGEMPSTLKPKVWWLLIGTNDLATGGCSTEAVLVGIVNLVLEIRAHDPNVIVVINSILPRSSSTTAELQVDSNDLWKDILWINERLECYVQADSKVDFFNATDLFVMTTNNDTGTLPHYYINETLMPDLLHPSAEGSLVWGNAIVKRVKELVATMQNDDE